MIYLIGGAPRAGKSILSQQISGQLKAGWVSTDLLMELLRVKKAEGIKLPRQLRRMPNGSFHIWTGLSGA
jgi:predicted kinase